MKFTANQLVQIVASVGLSAGGIVLALVGHAGLALACFAFVFVLALATT